MKKASYKSMIAMVLALATVMGILSGCKPAPKEQSENDIYVSDKSGGYRANTIADVVLQTVHSAYAFYDRIYNGIAGNYHTIGLEFHDVIYGETDPASGLPTTITWRYGEASSNKPNTVYLDPHDAWDAFINSKYEYENGYDYGIGTTIWTTAYVDNNWFKAVDGRIQSTEAAFDAYKRQRDVDKAYDFFGFPSNVYPEADNDKFWAVLDQYLSHFGPHTVDPKATDGYANWRLFPVEELAWAEWHAMHNDMSHAKALDDYRGMTLEEYTQYRVSMPGDETEAFRKDWYPGVIGNQRFMDTGKTTSTGGKYLTPSVGEKTFDEWYRGKGYTPTKHSSTAVDPTPTAIPTPVPTVTPTPVPTETPVPTPTPVPTITPEPSETPVQYFPDVTPDKWYYEAVNNMAEAGILKGYSDGLFHPDDLVTHAEVATIFCRISADAAKAFKSDPKSVDEWAKEGGHWATKFIVYATKGPTSNRMTAMYFTTIEHADVPETREHVFDAIGEYIYANQFLNKYNYRKFIDGIHYVVRPLVDEDKTETMFWEYHDSDKGGNAMSSNIANLVYLGIIHGDQNGNLNLKSNITRAEFCQVLYNMGATIDWLGDGK